MTAPGGDAAKGPRALDLLAGAARIDELWSPHLAARVNDHEVRVARIEGEFDWHAHSDTDEVFFVLKGEFEMQFRDRAVRVGEGALIVAPRGVEHRPIARRECWIMLIERAGAVNTGDQVTARTKTDLPWLDDRAVDAATGDNEAPHDKR